MSTLIVTLAFPTPTAASEHDYVLSSDGSSLSAQGCASPALLATGSGRSKRVVAVVPARALSWHPLTLPGTLGRTLRSRRTEPLRLRAVLAGLLEELLLDEPEQLHFAVFPGVSADAPVWVAVCQRAWLMQALQVLAVLPQRIQRIVPEFAPLRDSHATSTADVTADLAPAQLVLCTPQGVTLLPLGEAAVALLALAAPAAIDAEPAVAPLAEQVLGQPVRVRTRAERLLQAMHSPWNLAQFEFSASRRSRAFKALALGGGRLIREPQWRALRWGLALLLGVQVIGLNILAWQTQSLLEEKEQRMHALFTRALPEVRVVVDPPRQMERALALRQEAAGLGSGPGLVDLLLWMAEAAPGPTPPTAIALSDGELRLQGLKPDPQTLAALSDRLAARGWQARVQDDLLVIQPQGRP
ncbi:MAG: type II secretion system protein GspL [Hylemonella sp.]|uniref:type II secretion system protein GspL n=1 Tax=Hylemonella sp. TaxID=2066020 RepID=UPI0022C3E655|nr:type II secretion system protein GspL [Hylemonella sp.]MCZ8252323.1 type II secretion system protein GspL [Hylemonella sp.]